MSGKRGKMTQTLFAHMNKRKEKKNEQHTPSHWLVVPEGRLRSKESPSPLPVHTFVPPQ
jgi:hypothetical protein